jgi:ketosteroid isomerase-like protein
MSNESLDNIEEHAMQRLDSVRVFIPRFIGVAAFVLAQSSGAQQSDIDAVKQAQNSFFAAATARDAVKMQALWVVDGNVALLLPLDKVPAIGWDAAKKSWQARFDAFSEWTVAPKDAPNIQVNQGTAVTTTVISIKGTSKAGALQDYAVHLTQVFVKRGDRWLLVANHGARVPD